MLSSSYLIFPELWNIWCVLFYFFLCEIRLSLFDPQETIGVPVFAYGESREFPAFFSRHSGCHVSLDVESRSQGLIISRPGSLEHQRPSNSS